MQYISQRDVAEAATYAIAKNALARQALVPSVREVVTDVAVLGLVNLAGPTIDNNLDFVGGLPPIANRALKFVAADAAVSVLMGKNPMASFTISNLAAIGAGIYVGDFVDTQVNAALAHQSASVMTQKKTAPQPLTAEGV